jgi:Beta-eliminating lyase
MKENSKPRHSPAATTPASAQKPSPRSHRLTRDMSQLRRRRVDREGIRSHPRRLETKCEVFMVFNGTSANSLSLASLCQPYHSILCEIAHVEVSECGAPEFLRAAPKFLLLPGESGKIESAAIDRAVTRRTDIHYPKPRALTLTQATEVGTVLHTGRTQGALGRRAEVRSARAHGRRAVDWTATLWSLYRFDVHVARG